MQESDSESFANISIKEDHIIINVNPRIYPLEAVISAGYILIDKVYVILDGDPSHSIKVILKPKEPCDKTKLSELGGEFNNELLNYSVYKTFSERNAPIRQAIIQRALLTNGFIGQNDRPNNFDDPEDIAVPWEDKFGEDDKNAGPADECGYDEKNSDHQA